MKTSILSLNIGRPALMQWGDKKVTSSMLKHPVKGPLVVSRTNIEGDSFAHPAHGTPDSVLYAFGMPSAIEFVKGLGLTLYEPGSVGENLKNWPL